MKYRCYPAQLRYTPDAVVFAAIDSYAKVSSVQKQALVQASASQVPGT